MLGFRFWGTGTRNGTTSHSGRSLGAAIILSIVGLVGCENTTTHPLCTASNQITFLPGLDGSYSVSIQNPQTFVVETESVTVRQRNNGFVLSKTDHLKGNTEDVPGTLCTWSNGWTVSQSRDASTGLYSYDRVTVAPSGLFLQPILFDRKRLEENNIPFSIREVGSQKIVGQVSSFLGHGENSTSRLQGFTEAIQEMVIDNEFTDPATLIGTARAGFVSVAAVRE